MFLNKPLPRVLFAVLLMLSQGALAAIFSPVAATASSTFGSGVYDINDVINQNGLFDTFVSGVTDFDTYIAANPLHTFQDVGFEWFSANGDTTPTVEFDLGSVMTIDRIAIWNEEFAGFGSASISVSTDGVDFDPLTMIDSLTDHGFLVEYFADVFSFGPVDARYVRLDLSGCPQPNGTQDFDLCGIGEVAFNAMAPVPVPAALPLFAAALGFGGLFGRRRR